MREFLTKFGLRQPDRKPASELEQLTDTELHRRVNEGKSLAELAGQPAFSLYRGLVLAEVDERKDKLVDMPAEDLTGHKGVGEQNFIRGMVFALAQVAIACKAGAEAQKVLEGREAQKPA